MRPARSLARTVAGALVAACAAVALPVTASAGVTWDAGSLRGVYDPPEGIYAYGPSVLDGPDGRRVWTCHNSQPRLIRDDVYATRIDRAGNVVSSTSVLRASASGWDSFHVCDPSVVKGRFRIDGARYSHAMLYLGNDVDASAHNQIGVAFARDVDGPWVKHPRPLVTFDEVTQWGVGQPSAISLLPGTGRLLLFYTRGDTSTRAYVRVLDLGDMSRPRVGAPVLLPTAGLTGGDGGADWLNNYDVALDPWQLRLYAIREQHPYPPEGENPWWIGRSVQLVSLPLLDALRGAGAWRVEGAIDQALTGFPRNHNAGLARTAYGLLPDPRRVDVVFTDSCAGPTCDSLFGYDLWEVTGRLAR